MYEKCSLIFKTKIYHKNYVFNNKINYPSIYFLVDMFLFFIFNGIDFQKVILPMWP